MAIDPEILDCFLDEAEDALVEWERACLELEAEENSEEAATALFRAAHNLKGASRAVGLDAFGEYVHTVEDVIQMLMRGEFPMYPGVVTILLNVQVVLQDWVTGLREDPSYIPDKGLTLKQAEFLADKDPVPNKGVTPQKVEPEFQPESSAATPESTKSDDIEDLDAIFAAAQLEYSKEQQPSPASTEAAAPPPPVTEEKAPAKEVSKPQQAPTAKTSGKPKSPRKKRDETIRIAADKLDSLIQLIGELTIHQAIISEEKKTGNYNSRACQSALALSNKITRDLHSKALSLRMQPVQGLFQRLERVARDVARTQNKAIDVKVSGVDVELDKTVLERITDPLVHILRNAVDHGLEDEAERKASGKTGKATIFLTAIQDTGGVCIEVKDNGRGLNKERILAKAKERDLVREGVELSDEEIYNLLFLPGFSTAEQVTDISGRGVGMDVVMKSVQSLNGTILVSSEEGAGSTFSISLPTTLSIIDALVVSISNVRYAVPMQELTEIIDLSNYSVETSGKQGKMISLRGKVVPLRSLAKYLPTNSSHHNQDKDAEVFSNSTPALVVREGAGTYAFEIDGIVTQQQVVVRQLSKQLQKFKCFEGSTILGDGQPGMILNLPEIARSYSQGIQNVGAKV